MGGHQRDGLGDVERRAAAQSDHRVGAVRLVRGDALARPGCAPGLPQIPEKTPTSRPDSDATNSASIGSGAIPRSVTTSGRLMSSALR